MSERLEFPLAQAWSKGLTFAFEDTEASAKIDVAQTFFCKQVHGKVLYPLTESDQSRIGTPLAEADGLWAQGEWLRDLKPQLLVRTADCLPILMVDHKNQSVAALHAGWRGVLAGIHRAPFEELSCFDPKTTWLWIGPSLSGASFEVGPDMYNLFPRAVRDNPQYFAPAAGASDRRYFDVWQLIQDDYAKLGVELVYNVDVNTLETPAFASYRRSQRLGQKVGQQNFSWLGFV